MLSMVSTESAYVKIAYQIIYLYALGYLFQRLLWSNSVI